VSLSGHPVQQQQQQQQQQQPAHTTPLMSSAHSVTGAAVAQAA
jgi:hypothetical protein